MLALLGFAAVLFWPDGNGGSRPTAVDVGATYRGLSVHLQLDAPTTEGGRTSVVGYFVVDNRTDATITYRGCPFGTLRFGLLPAGSTDGPLTGSSETSCGGGSISYAPGKSDRFFAVRFETRSPRVHLAAGDYVAVVRFPDGTEVRRSITLPA